MGRIDTLATLGLRKIAAGLASRGKEKTCSKLHKKHLWNLFDFRKGNLHKRFFKTCSLFIFFWFYTYVRPQQARPLEPSFVAH